MSQRATTKVNLAQRASREADEHVFMKESNTDTHHYCYQHISEFLAFVCETTQTATNNIQNMHCSRRE